MHRIYEYQIANGASKGAPFLEKVKLHKCRVNVVRSYDDVYWLARDMEKNDLFEEYVYVVGLSSLGKVAGVIEVSHGGIDRAMFYKVAIFRRVLLLGVDRFILWHNHPSGSIQPSELDISTTKDILNASDLVGLSLLDHVIVTKDSYFSIREYLKGEEV